MNRHQKQNQIDTLVDIVTPENVVFQYRLAGPFLRMGAFFVDLGLMGFTVFALQIIIGILYAFLPYEIKEIFTSLMNAFNFLFWFLFFWFWNAFCEFYFNGQTFGKWICKIRVLTTNGRPIQLYQSLLRNIIRAADLTLGPFFLIVMGSNPLFQRLGDIVAGTTVVQNIKETRQDMLQFRQPDILRTAETIPPSWKTSPSLQKALALYVHRRIAVSVGARMEIASSLAVPLLRQMGLPTKTNPDIFLCALYQHSMSDVQKKFSSVK